MRQTVTIPTGTSSLSFWLAIPECTSGATDTFQVKIGTLTVFSMTNATADPACGTTVDPYEQKTVPVTGTGTAQTLSFEGTFAAGGSGTTSFMVDDVSLFSPNDPPTNIVLSNASVGENQPSQTTVGTFSSTDPDVGDTHTYSLVTGTGSDDNAAFSIVGTTLKTAQSFDFESDSSKTIRVRSTDSEGGTFDKAFPITVTDANDPPTNIAVSPSTVAENQASGTTVGTLSSTDQDSGATHTYTFVAGAGDTDNAAFTITGATLKTAQSFNFEAGSSKSIRVRSNDGNGGTFDKALTITVTDVNEAPTNIALSNSSVSESQPSGAIVGTFSSTDPDAGATHSYSLVAGTGDTDNAAFVIDGTTLKTAQSFAGQAGATKSIRVQSNDGNGGTFAKALTITVTVNQPPTNIALSSSTVAENQPPATTVGTLSSTDPDAGAGTHTYTLVTGTGDTDNAAFAIDGSTLKTAQSFDFETGSSKSVRVRSNDGHGGTFEKAFSITVTNVNEAPTDIALSNASVGENQPSGATVGTLSSTDPDAGAAHSYSLVTGTGDTDNAAFDIVGTTLKTDQSFDFEAGSSKSIRVLSNDGNGGTFEKIFTITVTNVNDAPTDIALSPSTIAENQSSGTTVGTLSSTDQDAGDHTYSLVAGTGDADNAAFTIVGTDLKTAQSFNFEADASKTVRVRSNDGNGGVFDETLTISVTNVNEAPTDIALSNSSVSESQPSGATVGTFSSTDPDAGSTHSYSLVAGTGDTDNAAFAIDGTTLKTAQSFAGQAGATKSIRVQSSDGNGGTFVEGFTINISASPQLSVSNVSKPEGNSGKRSFTFTVTRSGDLSGPSSVVVQTANGTAKARKDYIAIAPTTVTFAAGQATTRVTVKVKGDTIVERAEKFSVVLSSPAGATIADGSGIGKIKNDD